MQRFSWKCPYCSHSQVVTEHSSDEKIGAIACSVREFETTHFSLHSILCQNDQCLKVTLTLELFDQDQPQHGAIIYDEPDRKTIQRWQLWPESNAKPQPDFIPKSLREDYYEACRISALSPKASATLARRCLQGMIRDFTKISKTRLVDEVRALEAAVNSGSAPAGVTAESVEAIDKTRDIGNIGAHMEKDVDLIVDIEPGEAQVLIELIEMLFDEWYVARHVRQERLARVSALSAEKKLALEQAKLAKSQE